MTRNRWHLAHLTWTSVEALSAFVYRGDHRELLMRRAEWFEPPTVAMNVLWWVGALTRPAPKDGLSRLAHLRVHGPPPHAFTFGQSFPPPDARPVRP